MFPEIIPIDDFRHSQLPTREITPETSNKNSVLFDITPRVRSIFNATDIPQIISNNLVLHGVEVSKSGIELACMHAENVAGIAAGTRGTRGRARTLWMQACIVRFPFRFNRPPRSSRLIEMRSECVHSARETYANESMTILTWFQGSYVTHHRPWINQPSSIVRIGPTFSKGVTQREVTHREACDIAACLD